MQCIMLTVGCADAAVRAQHVRTFSVRDGKVERLHDFANHELGVTSVSVSADGGLAASSSLDSNIRIMDIGHGCEVNVIEAGPIEAWTLAVSADGKHIASGSQGGNVNLWNVASGACERTMPTGSSKFVMSVAFAPDGKHVACGCAEGAVYIFDVERQQLLARLDGHAATVRTIAFSADSQLLVTGADDARANLFEVKSLAPIATLEGHTSWVCGSAFAPDGSIIATCGADRSVRIWDVASRDCLQSMPDSHQDIAWDIAFDPTSSKRFASVGDDAAVRLYEATRHTD